MNNMYDILAKLDSVAKQPLTEGAAAPVVKTPGGFAAQAPAGKKLQTTLPKDRTLQPQDVKVREQMSDQQRMTADMLKKLMRDSGMLDKEPEAKTAPAKPESDRPAPPSKQADQEVKEQEFAHRASPTFGHSHSMKPGYDPTFRSPIDSPAGSEVEELEYLMSKGAMTGAEEMRLRSLYNKFGIRGPEDMAKLPQLRQQELERIEKTQAELQRRSAEANVASRDEMERQRAARAGVTAQPRSDVSTTAGFRAAYDRAGKPQPAVREDQGLDEQAAFQFSPEQETWLGKSDRQDPYIIARMPGPKPPIDYFTNPEDRSIAQRMNFGQQNLNRIKSLVGQKPGSADVFAPGAAATASPQARPGGTAPTDISTAAGFRAAYDRAGSRSPATTAVPADQALAPNERVAAPSKSGYQIRPGDTLSKIAARQGTTVQAIMSANPQIRDANRIQAGARLNLPEGVTLESRNAKPDFLDLDKDGNRTEPMKNAAKKHMDEGDVEEGNDFTGARLAAIRAGKPTFKVDGKTYKVTGDTSDEQRMDEGFAEFFDKKQMYAKIGAEVEGKSDDYTVTFRDGSRKRYQELDGRRRVTTLEPVDAPEETDDEGNVVKRGRGRPKGSKRSLGAKGPSGRSKLMRMEEDYDKDEYDEEGEMAKSQARTIEDAARELQDILDDDENLPEWVQKKIVLAKEYIDSARDYMKANPDDEEEEVEVEVDDEEFMAEKAVSKAQRAAAGIAYAAKKGDIPKSELRGASKEMAKMPSGELKKFAKTKEKGLPEKVKEEDKDEVEETTVAGSVAVSDEAPKSKKGGMQFGKGVYESQIAESFERKLGMLTEGMNINMSMDENGRKSLTVNATDDDAEQLADLLKMAGLQSRRTGTCEVCGGHEGMHEAGCGRRDMVEEELANSPDPTYAELGDTRDYGVSGGLNGPKLQSNPNNMGDNPLAMSRLGKHASPNLNLGAVAEDIEQKLENRLMDLYKRIS
jgi:LysM repeat protein